MPCVIRASQRSRVNVAGNTSRVEVLSAQPKRNLELIQLDLPAGLEAGDHRHYHHGEQCLLCVEGLLRLICGDHVIDLAPGDSCHFDGRVPHAIENRGAGSARALIAMTPAAYEPMFRVARANGIAAADAPQMADART